MSETDYEELDIAVYATVHIPGHASVTVWWRCLDRVYVFAFGDRRLELQLDAAFIPTLTQALANLPDDGKARGWGYPGSSEITGAPVRTRTERES